MRQALQILIDNAAKNVAGVGVGIRPIITSKTRTQVRDAILQVWWCAYSFECDESALRNLGLNMVEE